MAINIFQRQSFYYPILYIVTLEDTKLTVPLNMELENLRPLTYHNYRFESRRGYGCLSLHNVVCCQVVVSATSRSLIQKSPTRCGMSQCVSSRNLLEEALVCKGCPAMTKNRLRKGPDCSTDYNTIISYYRILLPYSGPLPSHLHLSSIHSPLQNKHAP
jgi:hypothetical protein